MDERLKQAYLAGLRAAHDGSRVEIHIGIHVLEHLRALAHNQAPLGQAPTVWGLPLRVRESFAPDQIEIHTVYTIPA